MGKLNNKFNLPEPVVEAIKNDPYNAGDADISTTRLISPPQIVTLMDRYKDQIEEDVSERIWSLIGQSLHVVLERAAHRHFLPEVRYFAMVCGWKLSGAIDLLDEHTLVDYKLTSVYTYIYGSRMEEWTAQGNVNRWLYHQNGGIVDKLENVLFLRDWTKSKVGGNYPPVQVVTVDLPVWDIKETEVYIIRRIKAHQKARLLADVHLPKCEDKDIWLRKDGTPARCIDYCPASKFCQQFKSMKIDRALLNGNNRSDKVSVKHARTVLRK